MFNWAGRNAGPFILIIMIIDTKFNIGDKVVSLINNKVEILSVRNIKVEGQITSGFPNLFLGDVFLYLHPKFHNGYEDEDEWIKIEAKYCFKTKEDLLKSL